MKPEMSEQLFIQELFGNSIERKAIEDTKLISIDKLTGDASTRKYYRVFGDKNSYVTCLDNPSDKENDFITLQRFLSEKSISVPKIYDKNISKGYILEEDLGDVTLLNKLSMIKNLDEELDLYKNSLDCLLEMHEISETSILHLSFDYKKFMDEIDFSVKSFFKTFNVLAGGQELRDLFAPICERIGNANKVFTHRDYHSRNLMSSKGQLRVIDFQDARMGLPQYDLVSLLEDCYYSINDENKHELIKYYYKKSSFCRSEYSDFDTFLSFYDDAKIQRVFKAIGSFCYIYNLRGDIRYLKYIGYAMENLKKTLLSHSRYDHLRLNLLAIYYDN